MTCATLKCYIKNLDSRLWKVVFHFKVTWGVYWVMFWSFCHLLHRDIKFHLSLPLPPPHPPCSPFSLYRTINYLVRGPKNPIQGIQDPDSNDLWKRWQVLYGDGQETAKTVWIVCSSFQYFDFSLRLSVPKLSLEVYFAAPHFTICCSNCIFIATCFRLPESLL
jgi:hypothetical protein